MSTVSSSWLSQFEEQIRSQGFSAAWRAALSDAVAHRQLHLFQLPHAKLFRLAAKDPALQRHFNGLSTEQQAQMQQLLSGKKQTGWLQRLWRAITSFFQGKKSRLKRHDIVKEKDGAGMLYHNLVFENWGRTVKNTPDITFVPKTKAGLCNLVKWATAQQKRVRAAGYRHTWGDLYSNNGQVLVSMLPLDVVTVLPAREPGIDPNNELQGIQVVGTLVENGVNKALCKIGAATTNEQFRRWCLDPQGGNLQWTIPLNVIMVEITWGGSNATICHGAGWRNQTLSDLVAEIEFVNARGELQTVSDPAQLKAAAGCFGLLGIVTSLTLKLDPMTFANMKPLKKKVALAIPPPDPAAVPTQIDMSGITPQDLNTAWQDFVTRCEQDYYAEWFWFPYQKDCWINTWQNDGAREDAVDYPGPLATFLQEAEEYLAELANNTIFRLLPGKTQAELTGHLAMALLPDQTTIVTPLVDGLHFRRGIQNMRVLDMELEIPLPPSPTDPNKPDWSICQKAWWMVIENLYQRKDAPMRIALEMRVMAHGDAIMAAQHGNRLGTCSIEVLTTPHTDYKEWQAFMQDVVNLWTSLKAFDGATLNTRPHWAKQWQGLQFNGQPANQYLKNVAYRDQIPAFKAALQPVAQAGGYTLQDCKNRFSNPVFDDIFEVVFQG